MARGEVTSALPTRRRLTARHRPSAPLGHGDDEMRSNALTVLFDFVEPAQCIR